MFAWNYAESSELGTIQKDLFRLIQFNQTLLSLSSLILGLPQLQNGFIGIHLRTEKDWPKARITGMAQMARYFMEVENIHRDLRKDLRTVYISSGEKEQIQLFRELMEPYGYQVYDKWTLLSDRQDLLVIIDALGFDEKPIVEYQMLLHSDIFLGHVLSTFSLHVAFDRSLDNKEDYFTTYITPGSSIDRGEDGLGLHRTYKELTMNGNSMSKLLTVSFWDCLEAFP
jgi:hypothetical protein